MKTLLANRIDAALKILSAILLVLALILTFTVSDYYIFNRFAEFNLIFPFSQWVKKAGYLLIPLAVFFNKKICADIAKYILPVFIGISLFTFGDFFEITMITSEASDAEIIYANINEFIPKWLNMTLFFTTSIVELLIAALFFLRDGTKIGKNFFIFLPLSMLAVMPLNIFENFFDISQIPLDSFLRFKNFTIWHALAIIILVLSTLGVYYFLKNKPRSSQDGYLAAIALTLLIQYHSKDSVVMGDGYNVYHTVFACIPLFICNIGVYVAAFSVMFKKRVLYAISFFVHAAGALTVFVYFGRDDMSNYGIFVSYSILFFTLTHCLLFILCVMPSALKHYKYRHRDSIIPIIYYCLVIVVAAISSGIVTSASMGFEFNGNVLGSENWLYPNYAFTQINPLPIAVYNIPITIWRCELNLLYLILLYIVYVGLFYIFNGAYFAFLAVRRHIYGGLPVPTHSKVVGEAAITDADEDDKKE